MICLGGLSCDSADNADTDRWWTVEQCSKPDPMSRNGVTWQPRLVTPGLWRYVPQQLCAFVDQSNVQNFNSSDSVTIEIHGRCWTLSPNAEGGWTMVPPWKQRDWSWAWFVVPVVIVLAGVIAASIAYGTGYEEGQTQQSDKLAQREKDLKLRESSIQERQREADELRANTIRWREQSEKEVSLAKTELQVLAARLDEQHQNQMTAVQNAELMLRTPNYAKSPDEISKYLRDVHLQGAALGDFVTSTFLADRAGFIRLAWRVNINRPQPPTVRVTRDGKLIRSESALAGEHGDHIVPGKRYLYEFHLFDDRGRQIGEGVKFEVKIPTASTWKYIVGGTNTDECGGTDREP